MNWGKVLPDASAYMLFEATGDSEAECVDVLICEAPQADSEDDALSCSDGSSPDCPDLLHLDVDGGGDGCFGWEGEDCDDSDEDDGVVDQCCGDRVAVAAPEETKVEMVKSEGERQSDRLFWEACLAS